MTYGKGILCIYIYISDRYISGIASYRNIYIYIYIDRDTRQKIVRIELLLVVIYIYIHGIYL